VQCQNQERQNYSAWCFKIFADFTDYVHHNQEFSSLNNSTYFQYTTVGIPVMSFQRDERVLHMVHCTVSTGWTKHKPTRHDTELLWMGMSMKCHFKSTAECIPALLKCHFIVRDAESSIEGLLALVQMFASRPICETACMVIVEERHQPPMQILHNLSFWRKPPLGIRTTYIITQSANYGPVDLLLLTTQTNCCWWYSSNRIDLNSSKVCYM
jgi:hypothetical protein